MSVLPPAWDGLLGRPFERAPHRDTLAAAEALAASETVFPPREDWFAALRLTPPGRVRAVILGQDPYHEPGQAMGLAFSVRPGVKLPPSLRNIYRELEADLGTPAPPSGDLTSWAEQGVLLLNTVLTVRAGAANSHKGLGWQAFTGELLAAVAALPQPIAFVLWGAPAQRAYAQGAGIRDQGSGDVSCGTAPLVIAKSEATRQSQEQGTGNGSAPLVIARSEATRQSQGQGTGNGAAPLVHCPLSVVPSAGPRLILEAPHPSPLSAYRGFFGSRPFSRINAFLAEHGEKPIRWTD